MVEETVTDGLRFVLGLEQIELSSVLRCHEIAIWSLNFSNARLGCESAHLRNLLSHVSLVSLLEAMIHVPCKEVALVAACKD